MSQDEDDWEWEWGELHKSQTMLRTLPDLSASNVEEILGILVRNMKYARAEIQVLKLRIGNLEGDKSG